MRTINISTKKYPNKFVIIDDENYDFLSQWKWHAFPSRNTFYAGRNDYSKNDRRLQKYTFSMWQIT